MIGMVGLALVATSTVLAGAAEPKSAQAPANASASAERHLTNIRQLTFGRQNAEAYFSFSGNKLIFQSTNNWMKDTFAAAMHPSDIPLGCYQMYVMDLGSEKIRMVSTGAGTTTCGYFSPAIAESCTRPPTCEGPTVLRSRSVTEGPIAGRWMTTISSPSGSTGWTRNV